LETHWRKFITIGSPTEKKKSIDKKIKKKAIVKKIKKI
jgi:hypothetical protein